MEEDRDSPLKVKELEKTVEGLKEENEKLKEIVKDLEYSQRAFVSATYSLMVFLDFSDKFPEVDASASKELFKRIVKERFENCKVVKSIVEKF